MTRFVQVTDDVTAARFGCDNQYFERFIKDKPLKVEFASIGSVTVIDENDEHWRLMKGDYRDVKVKEVSRV